MFCCLGTLGTDDTTSNRSPSAREKELKGLGRSELIELVLKHEVRIANLERDDLRNRDWISVLQTSLTEVITSKQLLEASNRVLENSHRALEMDVLYFQRRKDDLEMSVRQIMKDVKTLRSEIAAVRSAVRLAPLNHATGCAELIASLQPVMENMQKCLTDPVTMELFMDPVIVSTGQTFERGMITNWIVRGQGVYGIQSKCPTTNQVLRRIDTFLLQNYQIQQLVPLFKELELVVDKAISPVTVAKSHKPRARRMCPVGAK
jgi:hypothetical protein